MSVPLIITTSPTLASLALLLMVRFAVWVVAVMFVMLPILSLYVAFPSYLTVTAIYPAWVVGMSM